MPETKDMNWQQLLTRQRLEKDIPENPKSESGRSCFQRDYDRLVFSSPFRRLKDKTQVFSLSKNDYVRTRLIHSLEVSCVGRSLGTIVGHKIIEKHKLEDYSASDFGDIVSAACLAHDIGNPPFGHAGEDAIRAAFRSWWDSAEREKEHLLTDEQKADFDKFEGNAQGFRAVARLEMYRDRGGMQLTCPTLATYMKYPREAHIPESILNDYKRKSVSNVNKSVAKHGFFQSEKKLFAQVAETVGLLKKRNDKFAWWARHPLAFLVEAADDICYYIVDLEDGHRMGYISYSQASELLEQIIKPTNSKSSNESDEERIKYLRAKAIGSLIDEITELFLFNEESLLSGIFDKDLISQSKHFDILKKISDLTKNKVYCNRNVVSIEIAGHEILGNLFSQFVNAALSTSGKDKNRLLLKMLPKEYKPLEEDNCYSKIIKITDYISGMTDSYAKTLFQELKGIL